MLEANKSLTFAVLDIRNVLINQRYGLRDKIFHMVVVVVAP